MDMSVKLSSTDSLDFDFRKIRALKLLMIDLETLSGEHGDNQR